ncbi:uncharacterized protein B0T23DRAFT_328204, partial [Neurospora hispaniola]
FLIIPLNEKSYIPISHYTFPFNFLLNYYRLKNLIIFINKNKKKYTHYRYKNLII